MTATMGTFWVHDRTGCTYCRVNDDGIGHGAVAVPDTDEYGYHKCANCGQRVAVECDRDEAIPAARPWRDADTQPAVIVPAGLLYELACNGRENLEDDTFDAALTLIDEQAPRLASRDRG